MACLGNDGRLTEFGDRMEDGRGGRGRREHDMRLERRSRDQAHKHDLVLVLESPNGWSGENRLEDQ